jgi:sugar transferase (PEP-CTERM system associated)
MFLLDILSLACAWPLVLALGIAPVPPGPAAVLVAVDYPVTNLLCLYALGLYRRDVIIETRKALARVPVAVVLGSVLAVALVTVPCLYIGQPPNQGRVWAVAVAGFLGAEGFARLVFHVLRRSGVIRRRVLVVGAGRRAWDLVHMLRREGRSLRYEIGFAHDPCLGDIDARLHDGGAGRIFTVTVPDILGVAERFAADQIVVAPDERRGMELEGLLACKTAGFPVKQYLSFVEHEIRRVDLKRMELSWLLYSDGFQFGFVDRALKRVLDVLVCAPLLLVAAPFLFAAMLAILLDDGGPVLYRQTRVTRGGRHFEILKLRTMGVAAESGGAVWAAARDPRITRIGTFLRRTRLDELPQLVNVLRGDMSLVGPRPERPAFVTMLAAQIPLYHERHMVKAGLTGWAQVNYPYGASIDDARSKLSYDLYYVKNFSALFDLAVIAQTVRVVLWPGGVR